MTHAAGSDAPASGGLPAPAVARTVLVMLLWALCFPLISVGLSMASPLYFAAMRAFLAGAALLLLGAALRRPFPAGLRSWISLIGIGVSATGLGFLGMFLASEFVAPGFATVIANTQPLIAAVLAALLLGERLRWRDGAGLLLGFAGVVTMVLPRLLADGGDSYSRGVALIVLAAIGVAAGNILMKRVADRVDPLMAMGFQLAFGGVPLLLAAAIVESPSAALATPRFLGVVSVLALLGTAWPFYLWFAILRGSALSRANAFSFLTPVFGIVIGLGFFGETLNLAEIGGVALVLLGMRQVAKG